MCLIQECLIRLKETKGITTELTIKIQWIFLDARLGTSTFLAINMYLALAEWTKYQILPVILIEHLFFRRYTQKSQGNCLKIP